MKLEDAVRAGDVPPKAHLIHIALAVLGPGKYEPAQICEVLGYPDSGRHRSRVAIGARQLRNHTRGKICQIEPGTRLIVASEFYARPVPATRKKRAKKAAKKGGSDVS